MSKTKEKLATALRNQINGVKFSTKSEIDKLKDAEALRGNYLTNLLHLGWSITNMTPEMKKIYNWHGLDKYRFVPIGNWPRTQDQVYNGLMASTKEGFVRRAIKRRVTSEKPDTVNKAAQLKRDAYINDEETDGAAAVALHRCRLAIRNNSLCWSNEPIQDILALSVASGALSPLLKKPVKRTKKSLLAYVQTDLETLDAMWREYCTDLEKKQAALRTISEQRIFLPGFSTCRTPLRWAIKIYPCPTEYSMSITK